MSDLQLPNWVEMKQSIPPDIPLDSSATPAGFSSGSSASELLFDPSGDSLYLIDGTFSCCGANTPNAVRVFAVPSGRAITTIHVPHGAAEHMAISPDGRVIAVDGSYIVENLLRSLFVMETSYTEVSRLLFLDAANGRVLLEESERFPGEGVRFGLRFGFSSDGKQLIAQFPPKPGAAGSIKVYSVAGS